MIYQDGRVWAGAGGRGEVDLRQSQDLYFSFINAF